MQKGLALVAVFLLAAEAVVVKAKAPALKSGVPVIYLADNLDEKDLLGWCIDTEGRGYAEKLQAHSCKPKRAAASDTQFEYIAESGQIRSVPFTGKCMALTDAKNEMWPFGLRDCKAGDAAQVFHYVPDSQEIQLGSDRSQCVVVAPASVMAGPFMSRDLLLASCAATSAQYKQWVVKPE